MSQLQRYRLLDFHELACADRHPGKVLRALELATGVAPTINVMLVFYNHWSIVKCVLWDAHQALHA